MRTIRIPTPPVAPIKPVDLGEFDFPARRKPKLPIDLATLVASMLRAERKRQKISGYEMAERMETSNARYYNIENHPGNLTLTTLDKAAKALGCELQIRLVRKT